MNKRSFAAIVLSLASSMFVGTIWSAEVKESAELKVEHGAINGLAFSADGTRLAVAATVSPPRGGYPAGQVSVWDLTEKKQVWAANNPSVRDAFTPIHRVWLSPDGKTLVTGETRWTLGNPEFNVNKEFDDVVEFKVREGKTGKVKGSLFKGKRGGGGVVAAMSPDGKSFAVCPGAERELTRGPNGKMRDVLRSGRIMVWDLESMKLRCVIPGKQLIHERGPGVQPERTFAGATGEARNVWAVAFSPDGQSIAAACAEGYVKVWSLDPVKETATLKGLQGIEDFSAQLEWLADGGKLVLRYSAAPIAWRQRRSGEDANPDDVGPGIATAFEVWKIDKEKRDEAYLLVEPQPGARQGPNQSDTSGPERDAHPDFVAGKDVPLHAFARRSVLGPRGGRLFVHVIVLNGRADPHVTQNRLEIWDVLGRRRVATLRLGAETARKHDPPTLDKTNTVGYEGDAYINESRDMRIAVSRNGKVLAVGDREGVIRVYDVASVLAAVESNGGPASPTPKEGAAGKSGNAPKKAGQPGKAARSK